MRGLRLPKKTIARVSFLTDDAGTLTIFAVVAFALTIAVIGLIMDVGRVMNVHSQAQSYADRVALAAAAELDKRPDALDRAVRAAEGADALVKPGFRLTLSGDSTVDVAKLTFMSALGPDPENPYTPSPVAGDVVTATWTPGGGLQLSNGVSANEAVSKTTFVLVDTTRETENYILLPLLSWLSPGGATSTTVAPQALAGFDRQLCNYPPIFMCNIAEATNGVGAPFDPIRGQMIKAKAGGGAGGYGPGNFGLLDAPNGQGAAAIREYMARRDPNTLCTDETIDTKPGASTGPVGQGMNVRMDIYDGPMSGNKGNSQYAPAADVLKGIKAGVNGCPSNTKSKTTTPFPRDNCFMPPGTWPAGIPSGAGVGCASFNGSSRAGDGSWDRSDYWNTNHNGVALPAGYNSMTRYDTYRYETEAPQLTNTADEKGAPTCSASTPISDRTRDRRVLQIAVVNCLEAAAEGNPIQGNTTVGANVVGYLDVFLTEPVGNDSWWCVNAPCNQDLYVEVIGYVGANTRNSVLHEYPVLYR
ncbi:MAG TPA: Tad domain-containing protein [Parvularculaceae bacterium]|nr:Tad domain-containing protein [Parvularculaceae bacterium]